MKVRVQNCEACRKQIHKEEQETYLKQQYAYIGDTLYTCAGLATTAVLAVMMNRGRSKEYIQKLFDEIVLIYGTETVFGKPIDMLDTMHMLEKEYDIDFKRIHVNFSESEKEFIKNCKRIR